MGDAIQRISGDRRDAYDAGCDENTGVCGRRPPAPQVSRPGDVEYEPPAPKVSAAQNAAIARNMSAASKPKVDELSWRALRAEIASLESSKSDPGRLAACKGELARRQGFAPQPKLDELSWGALRAEIASLDASKSDPTRLAACKHELERRQGVAAEARPSDAVTRWGAAASAHWDGKHAVASAKVNVGQSSDGSVEIGSFDAAVGGNNELGAAALRITKKTTAAGTTTVELGSGKVSAGAANSDGSVGFHVAAQGNVVSVEHTEQTKEGASATGGLSLGTGFELSFGFKDDGICMRVGAGPLTLGGCTTAPGANASWGDDGSKR